MLKILQGDAIEQLATLPDESVHCCVTSPPYWGLRDYGTASWEGGDEGCDHREAASGATLNKGNNDMGHVYRDTCGKCGANRIDSQLGLEKTPEEYVAKMVQVFREVRRVLRKDGTLWLNLGDSYAPVNYGANAKLRQDSPNSVKTMQGRSGHWAADIGGARSQQMSKGCAEMGIKQKDLCGIPWRVAFALQADGWYLRQDIIWAKPNPMPESVTDRCTKAHEYMFLLTKSARYFYDAEAIREPASEAMLRQVAEGYNGQSTKLFEVALAQDASSTKSRIINGARKRIDKQRGHSRRNDGFNDLWDNLTKEEQQAIGSNKRSVWTVATAPYPEAHFATYPPDLIKPCIMAGTSAKGCCAKCGSPWERVVEVERKPRGDTFGNRDGAFDRGQSGSAYQQITDSKTTGWQRGCNCPLQVVRPETVPCTVLDPFAGSGTTGAVAIELGRKAILIELNHKYVELITRRCDVTPGFALA